MIQHILFYHQPIHILDILVSVLAAISSLVFLVVNLLVILDIKVANYLLHHYFIPKTFYVIPTLNMDQQKRYSRCGIQRRTWNNKTKIYHSYQS